MGQILGYLSMILAMEIILQLQAILFLLVMSFASSLIMPRMKKEKLRKNIISMQLLRKLLQFELNLARVNGGGTRQRKSFKTHLTSTILTWPS